MFARERKEAVLIYLKQHKKANIQELVDEFQVTGATIRTDLRELEKAGKALVLRPHKDLGVTRYTTDRELLAPWFQLGYDETKERMDEIRAFIEMD